MTAEEFFKLAKAILRGDAKATQILDRMVTEIVDHLKETHDDEDYGSEESDSDVASPDDDDDLSIVVLVVDSCIGDDDFFEPTVVGCVGFVGGILQLPLFVLSF